MQYHQAMRLFTIIKSRLHKHLQRAARFSFLTISKLKAINNNKSFYRLILILPGDISLNPGPNYNHHPPNLKEWDIFKINGLQIPMMSRIIFKFAQYLA